MTAETPWHAGDKALLDRLLADTRVQTTLPGPSGTDYLATLAEAAARWLSDKIELLGGLLDIPPALLYGAAWTVLALVILVLAFIVVKIVRARRPGRPAPTQPVGEALAKPSARPDAWAQELERRLAGADPRAALEALWWWLARALKGPEAEASWTTRELLSRAGRADLAADGRVLDRLLYGARPPGMSDVRRLAGRLQRALV